MFIGARVGEHVTSDLLRIRQSPSIPGILVHYVKTLCMDGPKTPSSPRLRKR